MLLNLLLQINQIADTSIWGRVADQAFSIVLLVAGLALLWKQNRSLEIRFNKYMEEDRKEMMNLISNNNNVIAQCTEVMKHNTRIMQRLEILHEKNNKDE